MPRRGGREQKEGEQGRSVLEGGKGISRSFVGEKKKFKNHKGGVSPCLHTVWKTVTKGDSDAKKGAKKVESWEGMARVARGIARPSVAGGNKNTEEDLRDSSKCWACASGGPLSSKSVRHS